MYDQENYGFTKNKLLRLKKEKFISHLFSKSIGKEREMSFGLILNEGEIPS